MKENNHVVVMETRAVYLQISPYHSDVTYEQSGLARFLLARFWVECWHVTWSLCAWSWDGLWSSVEMGFGPMLGKLGKVAVELLFPDALSPCLTVHVLQCETLACSPVIGFLLGHMLFVEFVWSVQS